MEHVPNWYRWLLIAGATLIMCACRAPWIAPGLTDLSLVAPTESRSTSPIDSTDMVSTQNHRPSEGGKAVSSTGNSSHLNRTSQAARALRQVRQAIGRQENLDWSPSDSSSAIVTERNLPAPVVRQTNSGIEVQRIDREVGTPFADDPPPVVDDPIAEFSPEEAVGQKSIHDGTMISPAMISLDARRAWRDYPDEYICDGGDANSAVQVLHDGSLRNLDPEDTVGHFDTLEGRVVVQPSNRIYIYAPRFAATRKVTAAYENDMRLQPVTAKAPLAAVTHKVRQGSDLLRQNLALQRHLAIQRVTVFRDRTPGAEASQRQTLIVLSRDLQAHEDFRVIRTGVHKQVEKVRLAEFAEAAISWSHDAAVQVVLDHVVAQTRVTAKRVEEFFGFAAKGSPKLRVIKTASRADALPGEVIEFTVRFDNVGYQAIGNVTIIDNLTTRLEYIEKTDECSVAAEFSVDNNDAESLTLRWEIAKPLDTGDGGIIRFKCRVR